MATIPKARNAFGFRTFVFDKREKVTLTTSCPVVEELFSALESHSEIKEVGEPFIGRNGGCTAADAEIVFPKFQAFVRQAKTFFVPAETLHHRARPLFYYYGFLNLAKALLCVRKPSLFLGNDAFHHGISTKHLGGNFKAESVAVLSNGVFCELYKTVTGVALPANTILNVQQMLRHIPEISTDYTSDPSEMRFISGKSRHGFSEDLSKVWMMLAVFNFDRLEKLAPNAFTDFHAFFERVEYGWQLSERFFNIQGTSMPNYQFFQSRKIWDREDTKYDADIFKIMGRYFTVTIHDSPDDFLLSIPLGANHELFWNEFFAGYVIFYYLGSLVRYQPAYLEKLLHTKAAWALEAFTKSTSVSLLRHSVNLILGRIYALSFR